MAPVKAVVRNGRLLVNEPTDLAEGTELELELVAVAVAVDDDFDAAERARVLAALDQGVEDIERGDHVDGFEFVAQVRATGEDSGR